MLTIAVIAMLMFAMSLGVMISNRELQGSCGGVGSSCACDEANIPRACELVPGPGEPRKLPSADDGDCERPEGCPLV
tara:strand:+ start:99 stop:329 length:231 start_codon:yes stop_codon:yes gene_type:complete